MDADQPTPDGGYLDHAKSILEQAGMNPGLLGPGNWPTYAQAGLAALISIAESLQALAKGAEQLPAGPPASEAELRTADALEALVTEVATIRHKLHQ